MSGPDDAQTPARSDDAEKAAAQRAARARAIADMVPAGARVLDLGCGGMELEGLLPERCVYIPSDLEARDDRTLVCDYDKGQFPSVKGLGGTPPDRVTVMGAVEYVRRPEVFLRALRMYRTKVLMTYCAVDIAPLFDREGQGWVNHLTLREFRELVDQEGFMIVSERAIDRIQFVFELAPKGVMAAAKPPKSVCVLAYDNVPNFGDRLGWSMLAPLLPQNAIVERHTLKPFTANPERIYDLVIVGIGNSLFGDLFSPRLQRLVDNSRWSIGVFGTQYPQATDPRRAQALINRLDVWFARYEEDLLRYGRGAEAVHLGDWLIGAFPMSKWTKDGELEVDKKLTSNAALDRTISEIQRWRAVRSPRLHPLLCALTSAERAAYSEQREWPGKPDMVSGKFGAMLVDVLGRRYPEDQWFRVDHARVARYREKVADGLVQLRTAFRTALTPLSD